MRRLFTTSLVLMLAAGMVSGQSKPDPQRPGPAGAVPATTQKPHPKPDSGPPQPAAAAPAEDTRPAAAAQPARGQWSIADVINMEETPDFEISPEGKRAVYARRAPDKEKNEPLTHLYLVNLEGAANEVRLTRGQDSASNPKWSPDGRHIAFLSSRRSPEPKPKRAGNAREEDADDEDPRTQIWLLPVTGGEPWPLTTGLRDVQDFAWAGNGRIVFSAQEEKSLYEQLRKKNKDTAIVVEDEDWEPPVRLYEVTVAEKRVSRLTDNGDRIESFSVSPDGRWALAVHGRSLSFVFDNRVKPQTFLYDLRSGESRQVFHAGGENVRLARFTPDSRSFYAIGALANDPVYLMVSLPQVFYYDLETHASSKVDMEWESSLTMQQSLYAVRDGFIALLADGVHNRLARYTRTANGWSRKWISAENGRERNIHEVRVSADGQRLAYFYSTASLPGQWFSVALEGERLGAATQLTQLNPHLRSRRMARSEVIRWKGALDEEVEGILYYPHDYQAGKRYPLVVMPHGGPAAADFDAFEDSWFYPFNLIAQRGAFALKPNYHGSSNYGMQWMESITGGKAYDLEVPDLEKGVEHLIARGLVDKDQLAALGWSYGSILTIALTVETPGRYKVAGAGAGDVDWISDWGNAHFGAAYDNYYLGKTPMEDPQLYIRKSPFYRMDRNVTPTIIFFGTEDTNVPTQQGWLHYRSMQQLGKAPVRFLLFPGEKHSFRKIAHRVRKMEEEMAWFDRHFFKSYQAKNAALKEDSPLAAQVKQRELKRDGTRLGNIVRGKLVPEVVAFEGLQVGRFEVTRAQFAAFDAKYPLRAGEENLPASGITAAQAQAYVQWLSQHTGEQYRLPELDEARRLYGVVDFPGDATPPPDRYGRTEEAASEAEGKGESAGENTLDYWAGYGLNPDDAARLSPELKKLGPGALLKSVGSFAPRNDGAADEAGVYDLGGNVAEWVNAGAGKLRALGGSADTPVDARIRRRQPAPHYIGLRVVRHPATSAAR